MEDFVRIEPTPNWVMLPPKLEEALTKIDQRLDAVEARAIPSKEDIAALRTQLGSLDPSKLQLLIATADQYGGFLGNGLN